MPATMVMIVVIAGVRVGQWWLTCRIMARMLCSIAHTMLTWWPSWKEWEDSAMIDLDRFMVTVLDPCAQCGADSGEACRFDCTAASIEMGEMA